MIPPFGPAGNLPPGVRQATWQEFAGDGESKGHYRADRLGLKEQQIRQYEASEYASASLARVAEVIRALDLQVRVEIILPGA